MRLDVLITSISSNKPDDCLNIIRTVFEDKLLKNSRPLLKNENAKQFVHEGLRHLYPFETEHNFPAIPKHVFHPLTQGPSHNPGCRHVTLYAGC